MLTQCLSMHCAGLPPTFGNGKRNKKNVALVDQRKLRARRSAWHITYRSSGRAVKLITRVCTHLCTECGFDALSRGNAMQCMRHKGLRFVFSFGRLPQRLQCRRCRMLMAVICLGSTFESLVLLLQEVKALSHPCCVSVSDALFSGIEFACCRAIFQWLRALDDDSFKYCQNAPTSVREA